METQRPNLIRFVATVLTAVGVAVVIAQAGRAEEMRTPMAPVGESQPLYSGVGRLPGRRLESVLTSPVEGTSRGTGWLLHSATEQRDACERADATSGMRMMCLAW